MLKNLLSFPRGYVRFYALTVTVLESLKGHCVSKFAGKSHSRDKLTEVSLIVYKLSKSKILS